MPGNSTFGLGEQWSSRYRLLHCSPRPDAARKALQEAGLAFAADVSVTGIDAPREAWLVIAADPEETADFAALPARVREALRDFHISIGLPQLVSMRTTSVMSRSTSSSSTLSRSAWSS